jgi:integrase
VARLTDTRVAAIKPPARGQEEHPDDLVTGLRLRVGAGGRKAWIVRARVGGKPLNKTLGAYPTIGVANARDMARDFLLDCARNGAPQRKRTFGELAEHWIENVSKPNNKSWRNQERRIEIYLLPKWRDRQLDSIRRGDVRDLIDGIEGDVAPSRALAMIRTLFRYAMSRDWVDASPAEAIPLPKADVPRDRFLDMDEVRRIYSATDLLGFPFGGYVRMLFLTGQRRTEVASMRWADIDLDAATWIIPSGDTKSARAHLVPLSHAAITILRATPALGEYVWTNDGRSHVSGDSKAKSRLDGFVAASGEPLKPWRLHDIRRTVATHMVRLGVSETIVGRVLNHAPQGVTARTYALHSYAPEKRSSLDRWAAEIERAVAGREVENVVALHA